MKLSEFKKTISDYKDNVLGFNVNHFHSKINLVVEYKTNAGIMEQGYIDLVFPDKIKKRIFYIEKSDELKSGWFSRKYPLLFTASKFFDWAKTPDPKYDDWEVYYAWNYDFKYQKMFNYIPLIAKVSGEPSSNHLERLIFYTDPTKRFKIKVPNLHEAIKNLLF